MFKDQVLVESITNTYKLDVKLFNAQIMVESYGDIHAYRFEPMFYNLYLRDNVKALSKQYGPIGACSFGLMQIILEVAMELGFRLRPECLFEPRVNLNFAAIKLRQLIDHYNGDYDKALSAYNVGTGSPFNKEYVDRVHKAAKTLYP